MCTGNNRIKGLRASSYLIIRHDVLISHSTIAGVAQSVSKIGYGPDERDSIPGSGKEGTSVRHHIQTGSGAHTAPKLGCIQKFPD